MPDKKKSVDSGNIVIKINKNTILPILVVGVMILLTYSIGRANGLSQKQTSQIKSPSPSQQEIQKPSTSPIPSPKTQIQKPKATPTPTPTPTPERKKIPVTLTDPSVSGTYYCYEDKANTIMTTQSNLLLALKASSACADGYRLQISSCFSSCTSTASSCVSGCTDETCRSNCSAQNTACGDKCPKGTECNSYNDQINNLRNQLIQLKRDNCP